MTDEAGRLTHLDEAGAARMVDVGDKLPTDRRATAVGALLMAPATLAAVRAGDLPKGDVLGTARLAGIFAAKRTSDLIPLCHPLPLTSVAIEFEPNDDATADPRVPWLAGQPTAAVLVTAHCRVRGQTGVEMEALTACTVALLTLYDMAKKIDRGMELTGVRLLAKSGGQSGDWSAPLLRD